MAKSEMTWNKKQKRWFKKYRLKQYAVSCIELGTPTTKEASEAKANEWWRKKREMLDAAPAIVIEPHVQQIIEEHEKTVRAIKRAGINLNELDTSARLKLMKAVHSSQDKIHEVTPNKDRTLSHHIETYRLNAQAEVNARKIKPGRYVKIDNSLNWLSKFVEQKHFSSIDEVDADFVKGYHLWLIEQQKVHKSFGVFTRRDHWQVFRVWTIDLAESRLIPLPVNLLSKKFVVKVPKLKYRYWTREEFHDMYSRTTERNQLFLLLTVNCGFYDSDIGCLKKSELNLKKGTITRQRTKTGEELDEDHHVSSSVPVITWYLWPETIKLLKKHLSNHAELALTNDDGGPLWEDGIRPEGHPKAGKYWKNDNIHSAFSRMVKSLKIEDHNTVENLRKTSAQFLNDSQYRDCVKQFGGWAERDIEKTNYVAVPEARFKEACLWLRGCYLQ